MAHTDERLRAAVKTHLGVVWRVLCRVGLRPADADDVSQDTFWILAQSFERVPERAQRSFLLSTALYLAKDRKRSKWQSSVMGGLDAEALASEAPGPDETLDQRRAVALLDEALQTLEGLDREVFILSELEQMTRREVAQALDMAEGTVATRLSRAREALTGAVRRLRSQPRRTR